MKRKHLLFKEAVCKNSISLIKLFDNRKFRSLNFPLNKLGDVNAAPPEASCSVTHFSCKKDFFYEIQCGVVEQRACIHYL